MSDVGTEVPAAEAAPEAVPTAEPSLPQEGESTPEAPPEKTFTQAELDKIIQKRLHTESRRAEREAQARESRIQAEIEARIAKSQPQPKQPEGEPQISNYQDYESYLRAFAKYEISQNMRDIHQQTEAQRQAQYQREQAAQVQQRLSSAAKKYSDFQEVALSNDVPISQPMAAAIAESDQGGEVAYWLGSNIDEAERISRLSPTQQIREITKLEMKLSAGPTVSKAPAPIVPSAGKASVSKPLGEQSYDEFVKSREAFRKRR